MAELLLDTQLNDLQRGYAEMIRSSGENLLAVINDILDLSKIEAGKMRLEPISFDPATVLEEVAGLLAVRAYQKGLRMTCRIDPRVPARVIGDPSLIRQVLTNLAGNAVKFTDQGGVDLEVRVVEEDDDRARLRIAVADTGIGIEPIDQGRIFESFTQVQGGNDRAHGGTGLGLAICRRLVALMGGTIGLESEPGKGSTFWFELELPRGEGTPDVPAPTAFRGCRVLVADDHAPDRRIVCDLLRSWGCRPDEAASAGEALTRLLTCPDDDPYAMAILDHDMPDMDGRQMARAIGMTPRLAGVPLVLLTSPGVAESGDGASGPFAAAIAKPIRRSPLYNGLCRALPALGAAGHDGASAAGDRPLPGPLKVLLAEDSEVNRLIAVGLVERLGCQVDAVANGRQAVEALDRTPYDLVFMDVQMPEMDGLAATAEIRRREARAGRHTPIIALTACAMSGDRRRCLEAGMDDHLTKPVRPEAIREALLSWGTGRGYSRVESGPDVAVDHPRVLADFNREILFESCGGDPALVREILDVAIGGIPDHLRRIRSAIAARDADRVARELHALKGTSLTVGAEVLGDACQRLKKLGEHGEWADAESSSRLMDGQWDRLRHEIEDYRDQSSS